MVGNVAQDWIKAFYLSCIKEDHMLVLYWKTDQLPVQRLLRGG